MDFEQFLSESSDDDAASTSYDVLFTSAEVAPYSKAGGLGDVAANLPDALDDLGHDSAILTPLYGDIDPREEGFARRLRTLDVPRQSKNRDQVEATIWEGQLDRGPRIFFIEQDDFFGGDEAYGYDDESDAETAARYAFFGRAIVEFVRQFSVPVDIVHCNDWHTSLAPVYRDHYYGDELDDVAFVLTIHNLAFQGEFPVDTFDQTGLPQTFDDEAELVDDGTLNYLKGGLLHADALTTVSPTYAEEIQTDEYGEGLADVIGKRSDDLTGILNGVDYRTWSPSTDKYIPVRYSPDHLNGKRRNKAELQHNFDLPIRPRLPLLGFVGRLTDQKGLDLLIPTFRELLEDLDDPQEGFQAVFLGEGNEKYANQLRDLADDFPERLGVHIGFSEELAHVFQAGCDVMMVPSRFEPCGLTQMYAMKYATLPLVHATGGLADTVADVDEDRPDSTGFVFDTYSSVALRDTIERALERYDNHRKWRPVMERAMERDFSWSNSASAYERVYDGIDRLGDD